MRHARNSVVEPTSSGSPLGAALRAQLGGVVLVLLLVLGLTQFSTVDFLKIPFLLALLQGGIAAMIALKQRAPRWWLPIHLAFMPLVVLVQGLDIAPGWFLAAFMVLLLVFWRTDQSRVPLYLTNRATSEALLKLLPAAPARFIDLGCGDGGLLRRLAVARADCEFVGIEHAPLTWLLARLRAAGIANLTIRRGNFWDEPLGRHDIVYAFLSPVPMQELWAKARTEMRPDALLVSNSFAVPGVEPVSTVTVSDRRNTRLFLYHPAREAKPA